MQNFQFRNYLVFVVQVLHSVTGTTLAQVVFKFPKCSGTTGTLGVISSGKALEKK
jgi:hypothetical protein